MASGIVIIGLPLLIGTVLTLIAYIIRCSIVNDDYKRSKSDSVRGYSSLYNYDVGLHTVANLKTYFYYCSNCGFQLQINLLNKQESLYRKCKACSVDKEKRLFVLEQT